MSRSESFWLKVQDDRDQGQSEGNASHATIAATAISEEHMAEPCSLLRDSNGAAVREILLSARRMCKRRKTTRRLGLMDLAGNFIRRQHWPQGHSMRCYDAPAKLARRRSCTVHLLKQDMWIHVLEKVFSQRTLDNAILKLDIDAFSGQMPP